MLVKELIEKLDTELDYIEITSDGESESFSPSALSENYGEIKEHLDKEVKRISFKTHDEYGESMDGEMYLLYTDRILEIEVEWWTRQ